MDRLFGGPEVSVNGQRQEVQKGGARNILGSAAQLLTQGARGLRGTLRPASQAMQRNVRAGGQPTKFSPSHQWAISSPAARAGIAGSAGLAGAGASALLRQIGADGGGSPGSGQRVPTPGADAIHPARGSQSPYAAAQMQRNAQRRAEEGAGQGPQAGGGGLMEDLMSMLGNGPVDRSDEIAASYQGQIDALTGQIPLMEESARTGQEQIGGFFDYAAGQAQAGMPVVEDIHNTAMGNVGRIHDQQQEALSALPQQVSDIARGAGGSGMGGSVADKVAAAAGPFMAAGESGRASTQANLTQHSAAGQQYLQSLASAAPSEAAMQQGQVQQALQSQIGELQMQAAALEGAQQRAIIEHQADASGGTMDRIMDVMRLQLMDQEYRQGELDMTQQASGGGEEAMSPLDQLKYAELSGELTDPSQIGGRQGFNMFLEGQDAETQSMARAIAQDAQMRGAEQVETGGRRLAEDELLAIALEGIAGTPTEKVTETPWWSPYGVFGGEEEVEPEGYFGGDPQALEEAMWILFGRGRSS